MKNTQTNGAKWSGFLTIALLAVIGFSIAACGDNGGGGDPSPVVNPPQTAMYSGTTAGSSTYTLIITENTAARYVAQKEDSYVLYKTKNGTTKTSSGTVTTIAGNTLTLTPTGSNTTFTVTIGESGITAISGTITFTDGTPDEEVQEDVPLDIDPIETTPEILPEEARWSLYVHPSSTATITYSIVDDGVCTITVGGIAMPPQNDNGGTSGETYYWNSIWKTTAMYQYTAVAGKTYEFTFEAWTNGEDRNIVIEWYDDGYNHQNKGYGDGKNLDFTIKSDRKTYIITSSEPIPKSGVQNLKFFCANKTGTFHVKILEIKEFQTGKLNITNYSSSPAPVQIISSDMKGVAWLNNGSKLLFGVNLHKEEWSGEMGTDGIRINGNNITLLVWEANDIDATYAPFLGNVSIGIDNLELKQSSFNDNGWVGDHFYRNIAPITFTNGNADINFATQMEFYHFYDPNDN